MSQLKKKLFEKIEEWRPRTTKLVKEFGDVKIGEVTIGQAIGGMRSVKCLTTDISYLDPFEGIRFRGFTIPETLEKLPKVPVNASNRILFEPCIADLFFLKQHDRIQE